MTDSDEDNGWMLSGHIASTGNGMQARPHSALK